MSVTATKSKKKAGVPTASSVVRVPLKEIVANTGQSRGWGVLSALKMLGYGLFDQASPDKKPIWPMLLSDDEAERREATDLIRLHEPKIVTLAAGLAASAGQLQPVGVCKDADGYDVIFGMRRCIASAYNLAEGLSGFDTVEAKLFEGKLSVIDRKLMAVEENGNRDDESPMDLAVFFKGLHKDDGMSLKDIATRIGKTDQYVRNYLHLLDPIIKDIQLDVHSRRKSVDFALKLRKKRKEEGAFAEADRDGGGGKETGRPRTSLPSVKKIEKLLQAKYRPDDIDDKEWELLTSEPVRRWLCLKIGWKYKEFKAGDPAKDPKNQPAEEPKEAKPFRVKRKRAQELLVSLGKTQARTWSTEQLGKKLSAIETIIEDGQKAETDSLQTLLDKVLAACKKGRPVEVYDEESNGEAE